MPGLTWGTGLGGDYPSSYCTVSHFIVDNIHTESIEPLSASVGVFVLFSIWYSQCTCV